MDNPIINLEKLSEPITRLIEVISEGIGTLYSPFGTIRQAKADAQAKIIHAKADADVASITQRASSRIEHRESLRQENIELVSTIAARELPHRVPDEKPAQDWVLQFFDCAQDVCDEDVQKLWGRILANEIASPGSFGKRTLQFLRTLDKWEAEKFSQLCSFALTDQDGWHYLVSDSQSHTEIREALGPAGYIDHFISIGLLLPTPHHLYASSLSGRQSKYFDTAYVFNGPPAPPENQKFGRIEPICEFRYFSSIGQQLAKIAGAKAIDGYVERLSESLSKALNVTITQHTE